MTKSSDKQKKIKGPIRTEAVVPFTVFAVVVGVYFSVFFDTHLRWGLEKGLTFANGAEVNVGHLKTSFFGASFEMGDIQITNSENPKINTVQLGSIKFKALWDGLLRGKVVIDEASINDIMILTPRKKAGFIVPKPSPEKEKNGPGIAEKTAGKIAEKYEGNILGDVASSLDGKGQKDQFQVVADDLKSNKKAKQLETELRVKEDEWNKKFATLPKPKEIEDLANHLKSIKFKGSGPEVIAQVQDAQKTIKEIDAKINQYKSTGAEFQNDFNKYSSEIKGLEKLVQEDISDLKTRMKIPKLDAKSIAMMLFGTEINKKLKMVEEYKAKYERYFPRKKGEEQKEPQIVAHERAKGRTYQFGRPRSYPLFWLKRAGISSRASNEGFLGDVQGTLRDVSSDPKNLGAPIKLEVKGNFPKQQVLGVAANITVDLSGNEPVEIFTTSVGSFPVENKTFSDTPEVKFGLQKAIASSEINGKIVGTQLDMDMKNKFQKIDYLVASNNSFINDVLKSVAADTQVIILDAKADGNLFTPNIGINSNLGDAISAGFRKQMDLKLKEAEEKAKKLVDDAVGKEKEKLTAQFDALKAKYLGPIEKQREELEKQKKVGETKIEESKKSGQKELEKKGQEVLDDLKKKFKF
ncbi:MAG: hypothetical protein A4S09_09245 [Proteobacteria bacterium SG_bin7]|nr:MAG: hypothetical protein A4S09_09245 [Proteobacteria bacterium SG_bin7]